MLEAIHCETYPAPIIVIKKLQTGSLLLVDAQTTIRYLDPDSYTMQSGFKVKVHHSSYSSNVLAFCVKGKYFALISAEAKESKLYNAYNKKMLACVDRHQGKVSCVAIDPKAKFMFSAGEDGRTFVIDIQSTQLAFTLPHHNDVVSDIAFCEHTHLVATASHDKQISLFHLAQMIPKAKLKGHRYAVTKILFLQGQRLLSIDAQNNAIIWDLKTTKIETRLKGIHADVTLLLEIQEYHLLFVATKQGGVLVYDTRSYKLLSRDYIKLSSAITAMQYDQGTQKLYLGTQDSELFIFEIFSGIEEITEWLKAKQYAKIQSALVKNPLLAQTAPYEVMQKIWEKTYEIGKKYLEKGDEEGAKKVFEPFAAIAQKNKSIQELIQNYKEFSRFKDLALTGKLSLAYSLAQKYPMYQKSKVYVMMEETWKKVFLQAQKCSIDPQKGIEMARELLTPYRGISEKTKFIKELLSQSEVYKRFHIALGQKNFILCFELAKKHQYLQEFKDFEALVEYSYEIHANALKALSQEDTTRAYQLFNILRTFPDFAQEAWEHLSMIEHRLKFHKAIELKDPQRAYTLLDQHEELYDTFEGKKLQEEWSACVNKAKSFAATGDINGVKIQLDPFMKISSKYPSIGVIVAWCYRVEIEKAIDAKYDNEIIEKGIKKYIVSFGLQDQIVSLSESFIRSYPQSKIDLGTPQAGSFENWKPSMIVKSILD